MKKANITSNAIAIFRIKFCDKPKWVTRAESTRLAAAKLITNPITIKRGRSLLFCPTDAPRIMGSIGSMQGAAIVSIPAKKANKNCTIYFANFDPN